MKGRGGQSERVSEWMVSRTASTMGRIRGRRRLTASSSHIIGIGVVSSDFSAKALLATQKFRRESMIFKAKAVFDTSMETRMLMRVLLE